MELLDSNVLLKEKHNYNNQPFPTTNTAMRDWQTEILLEAPMAKLATLTLMVEPPRL